MGKRKNRSKRSVSSMPKGLPHKAAAGNPFAGSSLSSKKRPKFEVNNRGNNNNSKINQDRNKQSNMEMGIQRRRKLLKQSMKDSRKSNSFVDRRIGQYNPTMTVEEQNLARLVKERSRRSKRSAKFSLEDNDDDDDGLQLTHRGQVISDEMAARDAAIYDDDDDDMDEGNLDAIDTALHFGGGNNARQSSYSNPYGPTPTMADAYSSRRTEMDDMIMRRKVMKAERIKAKEQQVEAFANMDESFKELTSLLSFRDKEKEIRDHIEAKRSKTLKKEDQEMEDWDKEMRTYLYADKNSKAKATDRTKTPEEIAQEQADKLQELETRRLARMNGDFEDDDLSDINDDSDSDNDDIVKPVKKKRKKQDMHPEQLDDHSSDDDDNKKKKKNKLQPRFTADGLVYVDKDGKVVKKLSDQDQPDEEEQEKDEDSSSSSSSSDDDDSDSDDDEDDSVKYNPKRDLLTVGARIRANYRAKEQFDGHETWYEGRISQIHKQDDGSSWTYDVDYDDGDFEEGVLPENVKPIEKTIEEKKKEKQSQDEQLKLKLKREKAKEKARMEIPFVFEVPTTLDALHEMIGNYATTGKDASLIIERIHLSNAITLDRRKNSEKMQNFYDVLLRRFVAVGDAIYASGDGGPELGRFDQLSCLTQTLFKMTQDAPDAAGAVWSRRLGLFQNAHAKRVRDAMLYEYDEDEDDAERSAWPSVGTILLLRALGHIFPVTDRRHYVVTPTLLMLGQMLAQTPVVSLYDLVMGTMVSGLLVEYTAREAKRIAPEALAFLAGVIRLYAFDPTETQHHHALPSLLQLSSSSTTLPSLREMACGYANHNDEEESVGPKMTLQGSEIRDDPNATAVAILLAALGMVQKAGHYLSGATENKEVFTEITNSLLALTQPPTTANKKKSKNSKLLLPEVVQKQISETASTISEACQLDQVRAPQTRANNRDNSGGITVIKSLVPRLEDPSRYSSNKSSKSGNKSAVQLAVDSARREYKREHKAISRELRLDASFIEGERRELKQRKDDKARAARQRNFAWLEGEQASMNQQVRQGGGLLKGGGMGAAKAKAATAKLGIKRGGKF